MDDGVTVAVAERFADPLHGFAVVLEEDAFVRVLHMVGVLLQGRVFKKKGQSLHGCAPENEKVFC